MSLLRYHVAHYTKEYVNLRANSAHFKLVHHCQNYFLRRSVSIMRHFVRKKFRGRSQPDRLVGSGARCAPFLIRCVQWCRHRWRRYGVRRSDEAVRWMWWHTMLLKTVWSTRGAPHRKCFFSCAEKSSMQNGNGVHGSEDNVQSNEKRKVGYWTYMKELYGFLGTAKRVRLFNCVMKMIRENWPDVNGAYLKTSKEYKVVDLYGLLNDFIYSSYLYSLRERPKRVQNCGAHLQSSHDAQMRTSVTDTGRCVFRAHTTKRTVDNHRNNCAELVTVRQNMCKEKGYNDFHLCILRKRARKIYSTSRTYYANSHPAQMVYRFSHGSKYFVWTKHDRAIATTNKFAFANNHIWYSNLYSTIHGSRFTTFLYFRLSPIIAVW